MGRPHRIKYGISLVGTCWIVVGRTMNKDQNLMHISIITLQFTMNIIIAIFIETDWLLLNHSRIA